MAVQNHPRQQVNPCVLGVTHSGFLLEQILVYAVPGTLSHEEE